MTPELTDERLKELRFQVEHCAGLVPGTWPKEMLALLAEVARLRVVVGKLPKCADGAPITLGMMAWKDDEEPLKFVVREFGILANTFWINRFWSAEHIYSTRELAEAARAAKGGE